MDLRQIEFIVKIAEEKNITKAAKKMYITQSALNQSLLKLEKEIGEALFERFKWSLELTEVGKIYIEQAKKILDIKKETYEKIDEIKEKYNSTIRVGLTPERGMLMFLCIYPEFHKAFPNVKVEPFEISVKEQHKMIMEKQLDLGFVNISENQKEKNIYKIIRKEKLVLAIPKEWTIEIKEKNIDQILDKLKDKEFVMLPEDTTIRKVVDQYFKKIEKFPKILFESKNSSILIKMVEKGLVCSIISEIHMINSPKIEYFFLDEEYDLEYSIVYGRDKFITTPIKKFIELAREYWKV